MPEDWDELKMVMELLEPSKFSTLLQKKYANGCMTEVLPVMDRVLEHFEKWKEDMQAKDPDGIFWL
jgi:hypothetical protein